MPRERFTRIDRGFSVEPRPRNSPQPTVIFDALVEHLQGQGLSNRQIAKETGRKRQDVTASAHRTRTSSTNTHHLDSQVEPLIKQGLTYAQIAEQLKKKRHDVANSVHRLITADRLKSRRSERDTTNKLLQLLQKFQAAHPAGAISLSEMAEQLDVTRERARQIYEELKEINPSLPPLRNKTAKKSSPEYRARLDVEVEILLNLGLGIKQIARELHTSIVAVRASRQRIRQSGKEAAQLKKQELIDQIRDLRNQGFGDKKIAEMTNSTTSFVGRTLKKLKAAKQIQPMRRRKAADELGPFDTKVEALREKGLSYTEMAAYLTVELHTPVSLSHIQVSVKRLNSKSRGEITN